MINKINLSKMSGKLKGFLSINTNSLFIDFCKNFSSAFDKTIKVNKENLKLFNVIFNVCDNNYLTEKNIKYNCNNKCYNCFKCYNKTNDKKVIIEKLKPNFKIDKHKKIICNYCYSNFNLKSFRKNCNNCYLHNNDILSNKVLNKKDLPIIDYNTYKYVRFNSYGELINDIHLKNLVNICKINKNVTFSLYTKRFNIVNKLFKHKSDIPKNLILVYSNPNINNVLKF